MRKKRGNNTTNIQKKTNKGNHEWKERSNEEREGKVETMKRRKKSETKGYKGGRKRQRKQQKHIKRKQTSR